MNWLERIAGAVFFRDLDTIHEPPATPTAWPPRLTGPSAGRAEIPGSHSAADRPTAPHPSPGAVGHPDLTLDDLVARIAADLKVLGESVGLLADWVADYHART